MRAAIRCIVVALALVVLAPAVGAHERGGRPSGAIQVVRVRIIDFAFRPRGVTIAPGTVVRWMNRGGRTHTTTSNTSLWNHTLAPGETFRRRFRRTGTFAYHCSIHPEMTGTVTVT
ncbi:MAG TPA: plastocyanin/azurin family copper-binding protein [Actinomycetota bacterium]|nr:plastocyanin/azurin family copper-binding protein [Actinomycetota bacterium]